MTDSSQPPARRRTRPTPWLDTVAGGLALRRPRDADAAQQVVDRADWLNPSDRALVLAVLRDGQSVSALARVQEGCPRSLRRRLGAAVARLTDDRTVFVARHLGAIAAANPTRARVARAFYLHGLTMRAIATAHKLSLHTVRAHRLAVEGMYEASRAEPKSPAATRQPDRTWR